MKIVTSIFGRNPLYVKMLSVCLYSLRKHSSCPIEVYYESLPEGFIATVSEIIDNVRFKKVNFESIRSLDMASQKMTLWKHIVNDSDNLPIPLVIMDCDMLSLGDITSFFDQVHVDFAYTAKDNCDGYPINTGVVFVRNSPTVREFIDRWCSKSQAIMQDQVRLLEAFEKNGSADQQSLYELVVASEGFEFNTPKFIGDIEVMALPSSIYNLHKDWSRIQDALLIHFKSGWSKLLLHNGSYDSAVRKFGWDRWPGVETWKPSWEIWRKYRSEYENLVSM